MTDDEPTLWGATVYGRIKTQEEVEGLLAERPIWKPTRLAEILARAFHVIEDNREPVDAVVILENNIVIVGRHGRSLSIRRDC